MRWSFNTFGIIALAVGLIFTIMAKQYFPKHFYLATFMSVVEMLIGWFFIIMASPPRYKRFNELFSCNWPLYAIMGLFFGPITVILNLDWKIIVVSFILPISLSVVGSYLIILAEWLGDGFQQAFFKNFGTIETTYDDPKQG